jgi:hypothetical protein
MTLPIVEMYLNQARLALRGRNRTLTPQEAKNLMLQVRDVAEAIIQCVDPREVAEFTPPEWPHQIEHKRRQLAGSDTPTAGADLPASEREP